MTDQRLEQARTWLASKITPGFQVDVLAGDASFRRYFRVIQGDSSYVLMDAPPEHEDVSPFLEVRSWLSAAGLRVPALIHEARDQGFLLLEDFGDTTWAAHLQSVATSPSLDHLFEDARCQLTALQASSPPLSLPKFDVGRMQQECDLYLDWYLPEVAGHQVSQLERQAFHSSMFPILEELAVVPCVPIHLDYHSRNLMLPGTALPLGVIDFQDAVMGPVSYDLASLLYDCYQHYPEAVRVRQSRLFYESLSDGVQTFFDGFEAWHRILRLTAMQRHIKAIGIFARLAHRDGKRQFLDEIPLTRLHLLEEMKALDLHDPGLALLRMDWTVKLS